MEKFEIWISGLSHDYRENGDGVKRSPLPEMAEWRSQAPRAETQSAQRPTLRTSQAMEGNINTPRSGKQK